MDGKQEGPNTQKKVCCNVKDNTNKDIKHCIGIIDSGMTRTKAETGCSDSFSYFMSSFRVYELKPKFIFQRFHLAKLLI